MPTKAKRKAKPTGSTARAVRPRARAKDVLGPRVVRERIPAKWQSHYAHLLELHNNLRRSKGDLHQQAREEKPVWSEHMADAGTDNYDQDFALSMASSEQNAIYEIEEAMRRIKEGTFGICELTGKPIEPARLTAIPWTRFSADAERELEARGEVGRTRLLERSNVARSKPEEEQDEDTEE
ncbi:MAG: transcriptional regulator, TraR/DksA family [Spartobacteria bacterium]|nr:transcriptional regulator, TraR/DksA family [Spartobacteria bacterium]